MSKQKFRNFASTWDGCLGELGNAVCMFMN